MVRFVIAFLAFGAVVPAFADVASTGAKSVKPPERPAPVSTEFSDRLIAEIHRAPAVQLSHYLGALYKLAPDGVLKRGTLRVQAEAQHRNRRRQLALQYARFDLDGDGAITQAEAARQFDVLSASDKGVLRSLLHFTDTDNDGTVTADEIAVRVDGEIGALQFNSAAEDRLFQFDRNSDGTVTDAEITATFDAVLAQPDPEEQRKQQREEKAQHAAREAALKEQGACPYPDKSPQAEIVLIGAREGEALSTVGIGRNALTYVAQLEIEDGDTPLYLVAGARESVIWEVTGAVSRVEHFVTSYHNGVVGVDTGKVSFADAGKCVPENRGRLAVSASDPLLQSLTQVFGNVPLTRLPVHGIGRLAVPRGHELLDIGALSAEIFPERPAGVPMTEDNGTLRPATDAEIAALRYQNMMRENHPAGLRSLNPAQVVTATRKGKTAMAYPLPPAEAGMIELLKRGDIIWRGNRDFEITRHLRSLSIGLKFNHIDRLFMDPNLRLTGPIGNLPPFSIYDTDSGLCIIGPKCLAENRKAEEEAARD